MTASAMTLADLTTRTGLDVLDHLERELEIPVTDGLQAQGDLLVIPYAAVAHAVTPWGSEWSWHAVPRQGVELLRGAGGGNPHTLVADPGTCFWNPSTRDTMGLTIGVLKTSAIAYLIHPEHGASGIAPGMYAVRRQRERGPRRSYFVMD